MDARFQPPNNIHNADMTASSSHNNQWIIIFSLAYYSLPLVIHVKVSSPYTFFGGLQQYSRHECPGVGKCESEDCQLKQTATVPF